MVTFDAMLKWGATSLVVVVCVVTNASNSCAFPDEAGRTSQAERSNAPVARPGQLTEESLGSLLNAMKLKTEKTEKRYDFTFGARYQGEEWKLSMSTVLSQDGQSIWVMAWLDDLPTATSRIPRMALLRLLAANDRLGNGKFFAYIPANKRFVLQRVLPNQDISTKSFYRVLTDLGVTVVETYPQWSVEDSRFWGCKGFWSFRTRPTQEGIAGL